MIRVRSLLHAIPPRLLITTANCDRTTRKPRVIDAGHMGLLAPGELGAGEGDDLVVGVRVSCEPQPPS
jgi:hypothetical protein